MRPDDIPVDEGKYITDNELIIMICVGWAMLLIIPVVFTSYLSKRCLMKEKQGHKWIIDSASRAIQGNLQSNVRAIAIGYRYNRLTLKCYLDSLPSEQDKEMLSDIAGEIISDFLLTRFREQQRFASSQMFQYRNLINLIHSST